MIALVSPCSSAMTQCRDRSWHRARHIGSILGEKLVAPQAVVAQLARAADAFVFADAEILAHLLRPPLVEGPVQRMLRTAVEHRDQRLGEQAADGAAGHRAAWIDIG